MQRREEEYWCQSYFPTWIIHLFVQIPDSGFRIPDSWFSIRPQNDIKAGSPEQVFFDKFWLGKFYLLLCKEEFVIFFRDKCICSKASMIAFEQVHLARKKLSHCRICSSVRVDKENLSKKIRKLRAHSGLVVVNFRISSFITYYVWISVW